MVEGTPHTGWWLMLHLILVASWWYISEWLKVDHTSHTGWMLIIHLILAALVKAHLVIEFCVGRMPSFHLMKALGKMLIITLMPEPWVGYIQSLTKYSHIWWQQSPAHKKVGTAINYTERWKERDFKWAERINTMRGLTRSVCPLS